LANGLSLIPEAARMLIDKPVLFLLIGAGMEKKELIETVKTQNLKNVLFLDPVPKKEVFKYILSSDAGLSILMKADTFKTIYSNKTFDYMSCKKPVIMAIDGISRELVNEADCGVYAEPGNAQDLAEKINIYLNDNSIAPKQGINGFEYARKHFDRKVLAEVYIREIENIVTNNPKI
jgi:glycosyltransferase involved in cell wall biosynthesis